MKTLKIEAHRPQCSPIAETPFHVVPPATSVCWLTHNSMEPTRKGSLSPLPNPPQFSAYPPLPLPMIPAGAKENEFTINSLLHPTKQTGCNKPKGSLC